MTELLLSKIPPVGHHKKRSFQQVFEESSLLADLVKIAVGYVSVDSLAYLTQNIEDGKYPKLELLIGMHNFEGFSASSHESAKKLNSVLQKKKFGRIDVCTSFPFHGKVYLFSRGNRPFLAMIGSSNLNDIVENRRFEVNISIDDSRQLTEIEKLIFDVRNLASKEFSSLKPKIVIELDGLLGDSLGVEKLSQTQLFGEIKKKQGSPIKIPLKTETKSNLNAFFGKGRLNTSTGFVRPRPWYEVELIVPRSITSKREYPKGGKEFTVITDDGWKFKCKISGDGGKNFRSAEDLKILGMWIKGRLEATNALKFGEPVTEATLEKYGRKHIDLIPTSDANEWVLDFSQSNG